MKRYILICMSLGCLYLMQPGWASVRAGILLARIRAATMGRVLPQGNRLAQVGNQAKGTLLRPGVPKKDFQAFSRSSFMHTQPLDQIRTSPMGNIRTSSTLSGDFLRKCQIAGIGGYGVSGKENLPQGDSQEDHSARSHQEESPAAPEQNKPEDKPEIKPESKPENKLEHNDPEPMRFQKENLPQGTHTGTTHIVEPVVNEGDLSEPPGGGDSDFEDSDDEPEDHEFEKNTESGKKPQEESTSTPEATPKNFQKAPGEKIEKLAPQKASTKSPEAPLKKPQKVPEKKTEKLATKFREGHPQQSYLQQPVAAAELPEEIEDPGIAPEPQEPGNARKAVENFVKPLVSEKSPSLPHASISQPASSPAYAPPLSGCRRDDVERYEHTAHLPCYVVRSQDQLKKREGGMAVKPTLPQKNDSNPSIYPFDIPLPDHEQSSSPEVQDNALFHIYEVPAVYMPHSHC